MVGALFSLSNLVENSSAVILARLLENQERFQEAHSLCSIVAAVSLRLYDQPLPLARLLDDDFVPPEGRAASALD